MSRTTTGRKNTMRLVFLRLRVSVLNKLPNSGTSPSTGIFSWLPEYSSDSRPPSTTMEPSFTSTLVSMERLLVVGPLAELMVEGCTLETSCEMDSRMVPFSLICGLTLSVMPTSLRSTVWNGFTGLAPPPVLVKVPVTKGTFWPMTILASSLSSVRMVGVDSTLPSPLLCRKRARKPST